MQGNLGATWTWHDNTYIRRRSSSYNKIWCKCANWHINCGEKDTSRTVAIACAFLDSNFSFFTRYSLGVKIIMRANDSSRLLSHKPNLIGRAEDATTKLGYSKGYLRSWEHIFFFSFNVPANAREVRIDKGRKILGRFFFSFFFLPSFVLDSLRVVCGRCVPWKIAFITLCEKKKILSHPWCICAQFIAKKNIIVNMLEKMHYKTPACHFLIFRAYMSRAIQCILS